MNKPRRESGAVLPLVAITLLVLVGFLGLAVDGAYLIARKTQLQSTADATALGCAIKNQTTPETCITGDNPTLFPALNPENFSVTATVPVSCPQPWQSKCVETNASTNWNTWFMKALGHASISSHARAIAGRNNPCLFGLATTGNTIDFQVSGSESATINCLIGSLSTASNSVRNSGAGTVSTSVGILTKGGVSGTISSPSTITNSTAIFSDPYAGLPIPPSGSCSGSTTINTCTTVSPGCYASLTLSPPNGCTMTVSPGLYYITPGQLTLDPGNNATISGSGVNFYVNRTNGNAIIIQGSGNINLTAGKYGTYANMLLIAPQQNISISGGVTPVLNGTLYAPSGRVTVGLTSSNIATTGNIVANSIVISNTSNVRDTSRIKLVQ